MQVLKEIMTGKVHKLSDVHLEFITASGVAGFKVMVELCQTILV